MLQKRISIPLVAFVLFFSVFLATASAHAFTSSSTLTANGVTYKAYAYSCNLYVTACSWNTSGSLSKAMSFTHTTHVKANGLNVSLNVSKSPGATLSGNNTNLVTSKKYGYGRSSTNKGVVKPSLFSVSVAARSQMAAGGRTVSSDWTTW